MSNPLGNSEAPLSPEEAHKELWNKFDRMDAELDEYARMGVDVLSDARVVRDDMHMLVRRGEFTGTFPALAGKEVVVAYYRADPSVYEKAGWRELVVSVHGRVAAVLGYTATSALDLTPPEVSKTRGSDVPSIRGLYLVQNTAWQPW